MSWPCTYAYPAAFGRWRKEDECITYDTFVSGGPLEQHAPEIPVRFYRLASGREPVADWLRELDREDRRTIGQDLMRVQFGWPIGMPLVRNLKDGLWEVRSNLPSHRTARLILCFHDATLVVLHGFIKKTQQTPDSDLNLARQRKSEVTQ